MNRMDIHFEMPLAENAFLLILLFFFLVTIAVQLGFHWFFFRRLAFHKPSDHEMSHRAFTGPVSVILCVRDEGHHLRRNLSYILEQDYPDYEVMVVDYGSVDDTSEFLDEMKKIHPRLAVISLGSSVSFMRGKKFPLSVGIRSARHDRILLTDAQCRPASRGWIRLVSSHLQNEKEVVLGYCLYRKRTGFFARLVHLDNLWMSIQYLSFALSGRAFKGMGQNMAFKKELFFRVNGFVSHYDILNGHDDLFVNQVSSGHNTAIEVSPASWVLADVGTGFSEWVMQKRARLSMGKRYRREHRRLLLAYQLSWLWLYPLLVILLCIAGSSVLGLIVLAVFLLRQASMLFILSKGAGKLDENKNYVFSLIGEPILVLASLLLGLSMAFHKTSAWK